MTAPIDVSDLVGHRPRIRWLARGRDPDTGMDCHTLALLVVRRRHLEVPDLLLNPWEVGTEAALQVYLERQAGRWVSVGRAARAATEPADLIVSEGAEGPHLSTLVDGRRRLAITIARKLGVQLLRADAIRGVREVLRWTQGAAA